MEKVILSDDQALAEFKKNAEIMLPVLKENCEKFSNFVTQISTATGENKIPNLSNAVIAALADSIEFAEQIVSGKETLLDAPKKVEVPEEFKAKVLVHQNGSLKSVTIKVPELSNEEVLGEWISLELLPRLSSLWGEGKQKVSIRGAARPDTEELDHIEFKYVHDDVEVFQVHSLDTLVFRALDPGMWLSIN